MIRTLSFRWMFVALIWITVGFVFCSQHLAAQPIDFDHANLSFYFDKSGNKQRITSTAHWEKRLQSIRSGFEEAIGKFPANRSKDFSIVEMGQQSFNEEISIRTVKISVTANSDVIADVYIPKRSGNNSKLPAILALHPTGAPGKRIIGGRNPRMNRQYANELAQRGYVVIAPDYPSFGDLKDHEFGKEGLASGTLQGILNHMRCVDFLESLPFVAPDRIAVIGHSLGGHNAIFVSVFDPRLKAIVSSCGWTPFHDYYGGKIQGWTSDRYMPLLKTRYSLDPNKVPFDFYELVAALAPRPFFSNSPLQDSNFEVGGVKKAITKARRIYSLYQAEKNLVVAYPKCGHDFPTEIREQAYQFLDQALKHEPRQKTGFAGELPRIQPVEPDAALKTFNNKNLSLVAHEPLVHDPIAMSFDARGRLFVIEMKDYSEQATESLGRVRMLEDVDRDGVFEKSTVFSEGLSWPTACICYDEGLFVAAAPDIWFLKDTNGDGKADQKKKVITGFGRGNVQGLVNCLRWGLDNRIHGATSSSGGQVYPVGKKNQMINLRGGDFSFDPNTFELRRETGGAQHGMCFDDFGNKFVCSNSDHAQAVLFDDRYLARNPNFSGARPRKSIAVDGGQAKVYRTSPVEPWRIVRTRLRVAGNVPGPVEGGGTAAGYFTGSTGITIYRGDAGSVEKGTAIIGDVGSNIVHRKKVVRKGLDVSAVRIDPESELITSTDIWFRPVQFGHGPDGCLYILDMYREVIEHPKSLPPMIKQHLDLTEGRNRGRIYRLGKTKLARLHEPWHDLKPGELVSMLNHSNGWHRETAARLIFEKQDQTLLPELRNARVNGFGPLGKIHALWAINGLHALKLDDLILAIQDSHPEVRRHAIILAEKNDPSWLEDPGIHRLANDPDVRVRWQLAFSLGELPPESRIKTLWRLLNRADEHPLMVTAIMSSANDLQVELLERILNAGNAIKSGSGDRYVNDLVQQIGKRNRPSEWNRLGKMLEQVAENNDTTTLKKFLVAAGPNRNLIKHLLANQAVNDWYRQQRKRAILACQEKETQTAELIEAIGTLDLVWDQQSLQAIEPLINVDHPLDVQLAAVRAIGNKGSSDDVKILVRKLGRVGRETAEAINDQIFARKDWTKGFLMSASYSEFPPGRLEILSRSADADIRQMARKLLTEDNNTDRNKLLDQYRPALNLLGDPKRGQLLFAEHCSRCHRANQMGFEIGPNLSAMKARGREAILANVLDPNREVNPAFSNYLIETKDGRSFSGMIASETSNSITLVKEKKQMTQIDKSEIEAFKNTKLSLMPTGLEKDISVEQMADLLEFLMTVGEEGN